MKNALILHGTDFSLKGNQRLNNWFPWLKTELEKAGYSVWVPELPQANHPDLGRYWDFLKGYDFNSETVIIGHSSGGAAVFGILHRLPPERKIKSAISVAGFYRDEGWGCEGLFSEEYDWKKIKDQARQILVIYSDDDPYVKTHHADYFREKLHISPVLMKGHKHFNLEAGEQFKQFPKLLALIEKKR